MERTVQLSQYSNLVAAVLAQAEAALAALGPKASGPRTAVQRQPSTTIGFTETFSIA